MQPDDETFLRANTEADEAFGRLGSVIEERVAAGDRQLPVLEIARQAGLELDERALAELQLPPAIPIYRFVPWHVWFPWRPIWCWWWHHRYPWYRCCPYWWWRCHWYPGAC